MALIKLNIGGFEGPQLEGWTCVDIAKKAEVSIDISKTKLPYHDNTVDAIYASHVFEHIWPDRLYFVLSEFNRVLKPGHLLRIISPDMRIVIKAYMNNDTEFLKNHDVTVRNPRSISAFPKIRLYSMISWFYTYRIENGKRLFSHVNGFDHDSMKFHLEKNGFKNIKNMKFDKCSEIFKDCDIAKHKDCSLYIETNKEDQ